MGAYTPDTEWLHAATVWARKGPESPPAFGSPSPRRSAAAVLPTLVWVFSAPHPAGVGCFFLRLSLPPPILLEIAGNGRVSRGGRG